jgi:hypothetical protein
MLDHMGNILQRAVDATNVENTSVQTRAKARLGMRTSSDRESMRRIPIKISLGHYLVSGLAGVMHVVLSAFFVRDARSGQDHLHVSDGTWEGGDLECRVEKANHVSLAVRHAGCVPDLQIGFRADVPSCAVRYESELCICMASRHARSSCSGTVGAELRRWQEPPIWKSQDEALHYGWLNQYVRFPCEAKSCSIRCWPAECSG